MNHLAVVAGAGLAEFPLFLDDEGGGTRGQIGGYRQAHDAGTYDCYLEVWHDHKIYGFGRIISSLLRFGEAGADIALLNSVVYILHLEVRLLKRRVSCADACSWQVCFWSASRLW
jgi:hypothetical protein